MSVIHPDGTTDHRYTFTREFCGYEERQWVARFCGGWIGSRRKRRHAVAMAKEHQRKRMES